MKKKNMIIKVEVDLENQLYGVTDVKTNTNVGDLDIGFEFMAVVFESLAKEYRKRQQAKESN